MEEPNQEKKEEEIVISKSLEDLKKHIKTKNLIYGTERTLKLLRQGKLAKVYMASNSARNVEDDITHYSKLTGVATEKLEIPNDELGTFCKKTFAVSVIGLLK